MKLPGFNAESSLGPSQTTYFAKNSGGLSAADATRGAVLPARRRQQSCSTKYSAYISHHFPVTVCRPLFNDLSNSVATMAKVGPGGTVGAFGSSGLALKSAGSQLARFGILQDCRVVFLPFIADVTTTQNCEDSLPDTSVLEVYGHPELSTSWTGGISNIPAPHNPNWFGLVGNSCSCCAPLFECPDGSCKPMGVSCDQHPA